MSNSLSSIILIGVVWLLLITTLFVRRQSPVRRTSRALTETRVVHEGGTGIVRPRRRPLPAETLYHSDPDAEIELVEAEPEQVVFDDTRDPVVPVVPAVVDGDVVAYRALDDDDTGEFEPVSPAMSAHDVIVTHAEVGTAVDTETDTETDTEADAGVDTGAHTVVDVEDAGDGEDPGDGEAADETGDRGTVNGIRGTGDHRFTVVDTAYIRGGDIYVAEATDDELSAYTTDAGAESDTASDAVSGAGSDTASDAVADVDSEAEVRDGEITEEDLDFVASRRGRGVYDPVTSRELAQRRLARRRRVLGILVAVTLVSLVAAVTLGGAAWMLSMLGVALTGVYLYSLRKQTVAEQELQRRRLARMRRARLGVRHTDDRELGVPDRLLRPGAVILETDDSDPLFADLDYAEVTFAGFDEVDVAVDPAPDMGQPDGYPAVRVV